MTVDAHAGRRRFALKVALACATTVLAAASAWLVLRDRIAGRSARVAVVRDAATAPEPTLALGPRTDAISPRFERFPLTPDRVQQLMVPNDAWVEYDPYVYFRYRAHVDAAYPWPEHPRREWHVRTNSLGLREDHELPAALDALVLVTGDSHTDGACDNAESYANLLEELLAARQPGGQVEVLNAGKGAWSLYNYLGALERWAELGPGVFVVTVYGGNDWRESLDLHHLFQHTRAPDLGAEHVRRLEAARDICGACMAQAFGQLAYLAAAAGEVELTVTMACEISDQIADLAARSGIAPVFVYLPAFFELPQSQWSEHAAVVGDVRAALELDRGSASIAAAIADRWLAHLRERGLACIDLREALSAAQQSCYWPRDHHLGLAGQRVVAQALLPAIESALRDHPRAAPTADPAARAPGAPAPTSVLFELRSLREPSAQPKWELDVRRPYTLRELPAPELAELVAFGPFTEASRSSFVSLRAGLDELVASPGEPTWRLRTDARGWRGSDSAAAELRVLLLGDEQCFGAFDDDSNVRATLLRSIAERHPRTTVAAWNASCPGAAPQSYLGQLDRLGEFRPNVVIVVFAGGNDFEQAWRFDAALRGAAVPVEPRAKVEAAAAESFFDSLVRLGGHTDRVRAATAASVGVLEQVRTRCAELGALPLVVYVPSPIELERDQLGARFAGALAAAGVEKKELASVDRMRATLLASLRRSGIPVLDLLAALHETSGAKLDQRFLLTPRAHAVAGEMMALTLEPLIAWSDR